MLKDIARSRRAAARVADRAVQRRALPRRIVRGAMQDVIVVKYRLSGCETTSARARKWKPTDVRLRVSWTAPGMLMGSSGAFDVFDFSR
jgi:hypothetical protein